MDYFLFGNGIRAIKAYQNMEDEEAKQVVETAKQVALILYNILKVEETENSENDNSKLAA